METASMHDQLSVPLTGLARLCRSLRRSSASSTAASRSTS
jgi:hypothetical protein